MEKLMYLVWLEPDRTRDEVAELLLGAVRERAARSRPARLSMDVWDPESDIPAPVPTPEGETPLHGAGLALARRRRPPPPLRRGAGPGGHADWRGTRWSNRSTATTAATSGRSRGPGPTASGRPGVLTVALLQQHPDPAFEEWITRWHTRISPITEAIQPRCRYVRNAVFRPLTEGAPPVAAIVEEAWPSLEHVTDPMLFYCADGDPEAMNAHVTQMIEEINAFIDLSTLRSVTMSEWILKS